MSDLEVYCYSLPRPFPAAILEGSAPLELIGGEELERLPAPSDGVLFVLHAQEKTEPEAGEVLGIDPDSCPVGLVGVGLVRGYRWPEAGGAWIVELEDVVSFERAAPAPGWRGFYRLPEALEDRIRAAWLDRPVA